MAMTPRLAVVVAASATYSPNHATRLTLKRTPATRPECARVQRGETRTTAALAGRVGPTHPHDRWQPGRGWHERPGATR